MGTLLRQLREEQAQERRAANRNALKKIVEADAGDDKLLGSGGAGGFAGACAQSLATKIKRQTLEAIAVRSRAGGTVVWQDTKDRKTVLDALLKNGAEALGMILIADDASSVTISSSLFEEYQGEVAAKTALQELCRTWYSEILKQLQQCGDAKGIEFGNSSDLLQ